MATPSDTRKVAWLKMMSTVHFLTEHFEFWDRCLKYFVHYTIRNHEIVSDSRKFAQN